MNSCVHFQLLWHSKLLITASNVDQVKEFVVVYDRGVYKRARVLNIWAEDIEVINRGL